MDKHTVEEKVENTLVTPKHFEAELTRIIERTQQEVTAIIQKAKAGQGTAPHEVSVLKIAKYFDAERLMDRLGQIGAWGLDQIGGVHPNNKRSKTTKMRKHQGYNG